MSGDGLVMLCFWLDSTIHGSCKDLEVIETAAVCGSARDQLPGILDSLPDDSAGKRTL